MTQSELIQLVAERIHDSAFTPAMILARINKGVGRIAGMVDLPDLKSSATVTTDTNPYVSVPSTVGNVFHRKKDSLFFASSAAQDGEVTIYDSWIKFLKKWPTLDEAGDVQDVIVVGGKLYYQPIPATADTLTLNFFRKPVAMLGTDRDAEPDGIPDDLQEDLLVSFACWDIFSEKEDEGGPTPETDKYKGRFAGAVAELMAFAGVKDRAPDHYDYDEEDFI